jgi:hypothetical protein
MIEAYPLYWPEGRKRLARWDRTDAKFDTSFARARDNIVREVQLLVGKYTKLDVIISTNIPLRRDGLPLANYRAVEDTGVAVYFTYKKRQMCFACDRWLKIEDNMQAICKTIEALRGIARWGTGDMMEAAFTGFTALPSPSQMQAKPWREVFGYYPNAMPNADQLRGDFRRLRSEAHPDTGGTTEKFDAVMKAKQAAEAELGISF